MFDKMFGKSRVYLACLRLSSEKLIIEYSRMLLYCCTKVKAFTLLIKHLTVIKCFVMKIFHKVGQQPVNFMQKYSEILS